MAPAHLLSQCSSPRNIVSELRLRLALAALGGVLLCLWSGTAAAQSNNVRLTRLSDVAFGSLVNLDADAVQAQSVCAFAQTAANRYQVTAAGSAPGGAFALVSGSDLLDYEVQWNSLSGQTSGTQLSANSTLTGQVSLATQQTCNSGPPTSASLILVLRATALGSAQAGTYNGTLTLVIGPE